MTDNPHYLTWPQKALNLGREESKLLPEVTSRLSEAISWFNENGADIPVSVSDDPEAWRKFSHVISGDHRVIGFRCPIFRGGM